MYNTRSQLTSVCLYDVNRFLSKFLTDHVRLPGNWNRDGKRFSWASRADTPSSLARPFLSWTNYFQAPSTQATYPIAVIFSCAIDPFKLAMISFYWAKRKYRYLRRHLKWEGLCISPAWLSLTQNLTWCKRFVNSKKCFHEKKFCHVKQTFCHEKRLCHEQVFSRENIGFVVFKKSDCHEMFH